MGKSVDLSEFRLVPARHSRLREMMNTVVIVVIICALALWVVMYVIDNLEPSVP